MTDLKLTLILLSAPFLIIFALSELLTAHALYRNVRDHGEPALAVVESIEEVSLLGVATGRHIVGYTLHLPGRAIVRGAAHVAEEEAASYRPGQSIPIVYARPQPHHCALSVAQAWRALASEAASVGAYLAVLVFAVLMWRAVPHSSYRARAP